MQTPSLSSGSGRAARSTRVKRGAAVIGLALGIGLLVRQCGPLTIAPFTGFTYGSHERPRVFVSHHPLLPAPGGTLTLRLSPDLQAGVTVQRAVAYLRPGPGGPADSRDCAPQTGGVFACQFSLPANLGEMVYGGFIDLDSGERVSARAEYHFSVTTGNTPDTLIPVRVPVNATAGLNATFRLDTAWIRDLQNYALGTFLADVEQSVYDGVLADPVYRWRDNQLGFYVYTREGFVTSYYSARDTRCGKNPWPTDPVFPAALASMEVLGLLHRRVANAQGVEGRVTGPTANLFRDCAGRAVRQPEVRTFSTTAGIGETPLIAKHEFGHAAFGLGDEYTEPDATRRVSAPIAPPDSSECCCLKASGGGGSGGATMTGGGQVPIGGVKRCVGPNGSIQELPTRPLDAGLLACDAMNSTISQACWAQPDTGCPSLAGDCVVASAWLGQSAPVGADSARPNVFPSQQSCMDAASRAAAHPGVEDASRSIGSCRPLCGATTQPCPCGAPEFWVADLNPGVGATPPPRLSDAMAVIAAPPPPDLLGGTCAWCIETSLCVRWHRALGDPAQKSWDACQAPPKAATSFERVWAAFFRWLADLLRQIVNPMKF